MLGVSCKRDDDKEIVYCNRVRIGNWFESTKLEEHKLDTFLEQMKNGDLMLARYRKMTKNLNSVVTLTQSTGSIVFGAKVALLAPHVPDPEIEGKTGLLLGGRISSNDINYSQELEDGCRLVGITNKTPTKRAAFILTSADYCDRAADNENLKYNQEFMLALSSSVEKKKPLYLRYDPDPIPGLNGMFPLYLSEHPVSNARWRVLPKQSHEITRFEREGRNVPENTDIVVNHVATNTNLGINIGHWALGFYGKVCAPQVKTCLDIFGRELRNNIWHFYVPINDK